MFLITAGTLGTGFAVAKTVAAVGLGLGGGMLVKALAGSNLFVDPLKARLPDAAARGGPPPRQPTAASRMESSRCSESMRRRTPNGSTSIGSVWPKSRLLTIGSSRRPCSSRTVRHTMSA